MNIITYFFTTYLIKNKEKYTIDYERDNKQYISTFR